MSYLFESYSGPVLDVGYVAASGISNGSTPLFTRLRSNTSAIRAGFRMRSPVTANATGFYVFQRSVASGNGATATLTGELFRAHASSALIPANTSISNATASGLVDDGWIGFTNMSMSLTRGETFWTSVKGDSNTDINFQMVSVIPSWSSKSSTGGTWADCIGLSSTDGWVAAGNSTVVIDTSNVYGGIGLCVVTTDDPNIPAFGVPYVNPYTPTYANGDEAALFLPALGSDVPLGRVHWHLIDAGTSFSVPTKFRVYTGGAACKSPDVLDYTNISAMDRQTYGLILPNPPTIGGNTSHRFSLDISSPGATPPHAYSMYFTNTSVPAAVKLAGLMGGQAIFSIGHSDGTWTDYDTVLPRLQLSLRDLGTTNCVSNCTNTCSGTEGTNTTVTTGDETTSLIENGVCRADIRIVAKVDGIVVSTLEGDLPSAGGHLTFPFSTQACGRYCQLYIRMCVCGSDEISEDDDINDVDTECTIPNLLGYFIEVAGPVGARLRTVP